MRYLELVAYLRPSWSDSQMCMLPKRGGVTKRLNKKRHKHKHEFKHRREQQQQQQDNNAPTTTKTVHCLATAVSTTTAIKLTRDNTSQERLVVKLF